MTDVVKASDRTFGFEIEILIPEELSNLIVGGISWHNPAEAVFLPIGWVIKSDSSVRGESGFISCEIVSPVLSGEDGLIEVAYVLDFLKDVGAKGNDSTGIHVHVGAGDFSQSEVFNLIENFKPVEQFLYRQSGESSIVRWENNRYTRTGNHYCKPSHLWGTMDDPDHNDYHTDRYRSLNLTNMNVMHPSHGQRIGRKNTAEFRIFSTTTDAETAVGIIYFVVALVTNTKNSGVLNIPGDSDRKAIHRALFKDKPEARIVQDEVCWDVLLFQAKKAKKAKLQ